MEPDANKPWEYNDSDFSRRIYLYATVLHDPKNTEDGIFAAWSLTGALSTAIIKFLPLYMP